MEKVTWLFETSYTVGLFDRRTLFTTINSLVFRKLLLVLFISMG